MIPNVLRCEQCGAPLSGRQDEIGCVHCLLQLGMESGDAEAAISPADLGTHSYQHYRVLLREDGSPWELGRGAMGVTYKAIDVNLQMPVALKVLNGRFSSLPDAPVRFLREAQAAALLRHSNVASVFHFGVVNLLPGSEVPNGRADCRGEKAQGDCFFAMELVEGETLEEHLRQRGPLQPLVAVEIGLQVARALIAAEKSGLIHRDLKPANIMILADRSARPRDSEETWVKVIDFGLAQAAAADETSVASAGARFLGTPEFASPEQLAGERLDVRSDIYSLGCTLWYALTGQVPFPPDDRTDPAPPVDQLIERKIPSPVVSLLKKMLATEPGRRPQSGAELSEELKRCRAELDDEAVSRPVRFLRDRRQRLVLAAVGLVALLLALAAYFFAPGVPVDDKSIAVLHFKNLSPDPNNSFFAEGLEGDLVASLVKIRDLKVVVRKSPSGLPADAGRDLAAIGRSLGVRHLLQGSVQRTGEHVSLHVSLLDAPTGQVLWAESYDRTLKDSILLQGELAAAIVDALNANLTPREREDLREKPTANTDAYLLYLRGLKFENGPTFEIAEYEAAQALYLQAIALDPGFALAHARLSSTLGLLYRFRGPTDGLKRDAFAEAHAALRLQPNLGEAHLALACCYYRIERNFQQALPELRIASRLLPNDPEPASMVAYIQRREGKWKQARAALERVLARDPQNLTFAEELFATATLLRDWPSAERYGRRLVQLAPDLPQVRVETSYVDIWVKGDVRAIQKIFEKYTEFGDPEGNATYVRWDAAMISRDYQKAQEAIAKFPYETLPSVFSAPFPKSYLKGCIDLAQGNRGQARSAFEIARPQMEADVRAHPADGLRRARLGLLYAYMGRKAEALREGERAVELQPIDIDAYDGPERLCNLALIHAWIGDEEKAIAMIQSLLRKPGCVSFYEASMSLGELRRRWQWDPLRSDPRFQAILEGPEPITVY